MGQFLRIGVGCLLQTVVLWHCLGSVRYVCSSAGCGGKGHCKTQLFWYVIEFIWIAQMEGTVWRITKKRSKSYAYPTQYYGDERLS